MCASMALRALPSESNVFICTELQSEAARPGGNEGSHFRAEQGSWEQWENLDERVLRACGEDHPRCALPTCIVPHASQGPWVHRRYLPSALPLLQYKLPGLYLLPQELARGGHVEPHLWVDK